MAQMKLTPFSEVVDEVWGEKGTPKRDAMEKQLKEDVNSYYLCNPVRDARLASMKTCLKICMILVALLATGLPAVAQNNTVPDKMYVCLSDGTIVPYKIENVDSIVFYEPEILKEKVSQEHAVDLGLSVLWADMNVGATSPEEFGDYYAWGETSAKDFYSYYDASSYKYYVDSEYQNIGEDISGTKYDAAYVKWGGKWRMPTYAEIQELNEKCTWTYDWNKSYNQVTGPNGNSIILPANDGGGYGIYWSSAYCESDSSQAKYLFFKGPYRSPDYYSNLDYRYNIKGIRPVMDKNPEYEELIREMQEFLTGDIVLSTKVTMSGVDKTYLENGCPAKFKFQWSNTDNHTLTISLLDFTYGNMGMIVNFKCDVKTMALNSWEKKEYTGDGWIKFYGTDGSWWGQYEDGSDFGGDGSASDSIVKGSSIQGYYNAKTHQIEMIINYNMMNVRSEIMLQTIGKERIKNFDEEKAQYEEALEAYKKEHGMV